MDADQARELRQKALEHEAAKRSFLQGTPESDDTRIVLAAQRYVDTGEELVNAIEAHCQGAAPT